MCLLPLSCCLLLYIRQKSHEPSDFYCRFYRALLFCRQTQALSTNHTTVRIDELLQQLRVFVVHVLNVILRQDIIRHNLYLVLLLTTNYVLLTIKKVYHPDLYHLSDNQSHQCLSPNSDPAPPPLEQRLRQSCRFLSDRIELVQR